MTQIAAILFDKDGTLFDFATTWESWASSALLRLCAQDHAAATLLGHTVGFDLETRQFAPDSVVIAGTPQEVAAALSAALPQMDDADVLDVLNAEAEHAPQVEAVPLRAFLTDLRGRDLRLGVATNDAEIPARAHLAQAGVEALFDFIAGYDSGYGGKPAPGQMQAFMRAMDLEPAHCVMVGDSTHDLLAGRAAGMACVGVLTGLADAATLAPHADVVLPDIGHLPEWLFAR